jgi:O-antigen/teichoic acid export membrane protein
MASEEEVGVFTMAARLVSLAVFVMTPIINTFSPHVAHLHHIGDRSGVSTAYGSATRWIVQLSAPAFVALLLVPDLLLRVLGGTAAAGATAVVILAIGQMVSAAAGPCGVVLNMSGKVSLSLMDNVGVLLLNIVLNIVLIPEYGIIGAAIAFSAALIVGNLAKVAQVRMILGVEARRPALLRTGAVSAIWGWGVRDVSSIWWLELLLVLAVVGLVYVATLAWVGLDREDLRFFRSLTRGRRTPPPEGSTQG